MIRNFGRHLRSGCAAALGAMLLLQGCTTGSGRAVLRDVAYAGAEPEGSHAGTADCRSAPPAGAPAPVQAYDANTAVFGGLLRGRREADPAGRVRYIFHTHGMGLTDRCEFANALLDHLVARGYRATEPQSGWIPAATRTRHYVRGEGLDCRSPEAAGAKPCVYDDFGDYRIDRLRGPGGDTVVLYSYYWHWDLWRVQYRYLADDLAQDPGWLAGILKHGTVDEGLSDAAAYLGTMGGPLREGMDTAICEMLRDAAEQAASGSGSSGLNGCLIGDQATRVAERGVDFGFLSHSLGSRMLFDVLGGTWTGPYQSADAAGIVPPAEIRTASYRVLEDRTAIFFMAANQLPLLGPGSVRVGPTEPPAGLVESPCAALPAFLMRRCEADIAKALPVAEAEAATRLQVVGFHDPGDLLGFRVSGGMTGRDYPGVEFLTVEHRNAPQILWLGTWPLAAHDQELARDSASALILCGGVRDGHRLRPRACGARD